MYKSVEYTNSLGKLVALISGFTDYINMGDYIFYTNPEGPGWLNELGSWIT